MNEWFQEMTRNGPYQRYPKKATKQGKGPQGHNMTIGKAMCTKAEASKLSKSKGEAL